MRNLPDRRVLIRYMFDALCLVLILGLNFVVHSVLRADLWFRLIFREDSAGSANVLAAAILYCLLTGNLCWITASGLKRNKRWSFPVGVFTSSLLVLGFPWLTIAGATGLYLLIATPPSPSPTAAPATSKPTKDFWDSKRRSKAQPVVLTIFLSAVLGLPVWFGIYAQQHAGMPDWFPGWRWWLWLSVFMLINTALHESGHSIVAWSVGFQLRIISIGPFIFWREHSGFQFRFDLRRLFHGGGYMHAIPISDRNLRLNHIAVIAAGPATNALTSLVCLVVFFSLPGTAWQTWWWIPAFNAVIAGVGTVANLVPVGYCDGTMLLHLILGTPAGRLLLDRQRVIMMGEEADACHGQAAFDKEIELKKAMLERSLGSGQDNAFMIAASHQALGSAYALANDWPAAEFHYRKCLDFEAELAAHLGLAGNAWSGLHYTSIRRQHVAAVVPAYASTIGILEKQKTGGNGDPRGPVVTCAMLAQAHLRNGSFGTALGEIEQGLKSLPSGSSSISQRAHFFRSKAMCHLHLGEIDAGIAAARSAYDLFRSPEIPRDRRNLAWEDIADLGHELWSAGQSTPSIDFLREAITHLESGGAALVAAQYRIKLARIFRQLGRLDEAGQELPAEPPLFPALHRAFLAERAQLYLASGRPELAVADCRELVDLWRAHPCAPAPEIATAEALLAKACLAAGDFLEAETLAIQAADVLGPWQHPDAASCLITLALARAQSTGESDSALIGEAFRLLESAVLLTPVEKARLKEGETARIEQSPAAVPVLV